MKHVASTAFLMETFNLGHGRRTKNYRRLWILRILRLVLQRVRFASVCCGWHWVLEGQRCREYDRTMQGCSRSTPTLTRELLHI